MIVATLWTICSTAVGIHIRLLRHSSHLGTIKYRDVLIICSQSISGHAAVSQTAYLVHRTEDNFRISTFYQCNLLFRGLDHLQNSSTSRLVDKFYQARSKALARQKQWRTRYMRCGVLRYCHPCCNIVATKVGQEQIEQEQVLVRQRFSC